MSEYFDELCRTMKTIAEDPRAIFIGQAVEYPGTAMSNTLKGIPDDRKIEFPVAEDMQLGVATGLSLGGWLPICIFPRWSFLLLAINQLVLHLDKLSIYSKGGYRPKVIIRTAVPTPVPLDPGPQHLGDFTDALDLVLDTVAIFPLKTTADVRKCYDSAIKYEGSAILIEYSELYT